MEKCNTCYYTGNDCDDIISSTICRYIPFDKNMQRLIEENKKLKKELLQYKSDYEMLDEENDRLLEKIDSLEEENRKLLSKIASFDNKELKDTLRKLVMLVSEDEV